MRCRDEDGGPSSRSIPNGALVSRRIVLLLGFPRPPRTRQRHDGACRIRRRGGRGDRSVPGGNASAGPLRFRPTWKAGERDATQDSSSDQRAGRCHGFFGSFASSSWQGRSAGRNRAMGLGPLPARSKRYPGTLGHLDLKGAAAYSPASGRVEDRAVLARGKRARARSRRAATGLRDLVLWRISWYLHRGAQRKNVSSRRAPWGCG
jgi:hypothetical protein